MALFLLRVVFSNNVATSFPLAPPSRAVKPAASRFSPHSRLYSRTEEEIVTTSATAYLVDPPDIDKSNIWETVASSVYNVKEDPTQIRDFVQLVTVLRVGVPSLLASTAAKLVYPSVALWLAAVINDSGAFAVISQDSSQYIQNILTTSGLVFSLLVGQTYYFMYQQQEAIYLALYEEVTAAKSLLEQIGLVSQGRASLYNRILQCIDLYVREDLNHFNDIEPAVMLSARPVDDPLQDILYLTSVGEPSIVYQTVRSLRQARAYRLGALQRKLPSIHMTLLWSLAAIVLCSFPLLGAGAQTIGGIGILTVQAWYLSFIVFGICMTMGVIYELQKPGENGAYNARTVLQVMVAGLEEELQLRLTGDFVPNSAGPTLDINRMPPPSAALLSLETAEEVLEGQASSTQPNKIVDVETEELEQPAAGTEKQKRGIRKRVKTWASELVQNSITKFK